VYLAFYWDHYLTLRAANMNEEGMIKIIRGLRKVNREIMLLAPQLLATRELLHLASEGSSCWTVENDPLRRGTTGGLPDLIQEVQFGDLEKRAALLFGFVKLVENLLVLSAEDQNRIQVTSSAAYLCRLCALVTSDQNELEVFPKVQALSLTRCLFWSGLVLTKATSLTGKHFIVIPELIIAHNWIRSTLARRLQCWTTASRRTYMETKFKALLVVLDNADACPLQDIWTFNFSGSSVYKCNRVTGRVHFRGKS
jgi:hypothetical protein